MSCRAGRVESDSVPSRPLSYSFPAYQRTAARQTWYDRRNGKHGSTAFEAVNMVRVGQDRTSQASCETLFVHVRLRYRPLAADEKGWTTYVGVFRDNERWIHEHGCQQHGDSFLASGPDDVRLLSPAPRAKLSNSPSSGRQGRSSCRQACIRPRYRLELLEFCFRFKGTSSPVRSSP